MSLRATHTTQPNTIDNLDYRIYDFNTQCRKHNVQYAVQYNTRGYKGQYTRYHIQYTVCSIMQYKKRSI